MDQQPSGSNPEQALLTHYCGLVNLKKGTFGCRINISRKDSETERVQLRHSKA
jgi:hypothetical protein